jgi:hypothetical protein
MARRKAAAQGMSQGIDIRYHYDYHQAKEGGPNRWVAGVLVPQWAAAAEPGEAGAVGEKGKTSMKGRGGNHRAQLDNNNKWHGGYRSH